MVESTLKSATSEPRQGSSFKIDVSRGRRVAVSSGHRLASEAAVQTYLDGGNLIDAAIVGAAVLGVVLPYACGIGGDAYLLYHEAASGKTHALNGTGAAPSGAKRSMFLNGMPTTGIHAPTVPGALALWEDALRWHGTRSLADALQPAIDFARNGFPVHLGLVENIEHKRDLLLKDAECAQLFLFGDNKLEVGQRFVQRDLGRVLQEIAKRGAKEFYCGAIGDEFVSKVARAGGLFSREDLAGHRTLVQEALCTSFYGNDIVTMPPNSVGLHLLLQLRALEAAKVHLFTPDSFEFWRLTIDTWRWALERSEESIGDPFATGARAATLLRDIEERPSSLWPWAEKSPGPQPSGDTSNLVAMDEFGNSVSLVQSVSAPFASGIVVPGTGILLNNRMRGFNTTEGSVNCVAPGRRPKHTLVPVLVQQNGRAVMAIGTPGAAGQPLTLAQSLARTLACRQETARAIKAPRWSVGLSGDIIVEKTTPAEIIDALRIQEPALEITGERHVRFGSIKAVYRDEDTLCAAADYRRVAATAAA